MTGTSMQQQDRGHTSFLTNASALLASRLVVAALGWAGTVLIVRALSVDDFGRFTFVFSLLGVLSIITDMGIGRIAMAGLLPGKGDRARFAGSYVLLRCLLGVVGYLAALGFVLAAGYSPDVVRATAVAGIVVMLSTPAHAYVTVFEAHRRMRGVALVEAIGRVAQLAMIVGVTIAGGSLVLFTLPAVLAELVVLAWVMPMAHRLISFKYRVDLSIWWRLLREAALLSVGAALTTLYYRVDTLMLSKLDGFAAVGVYGVVYKFVDLTQFVSTAITVAILPLLVSAWPDNMNVFRSYVRRGGVLLTLAAGFIIIQFTIFAEPLILLLYGQEYLVGATTGRILVASQCLMYLASFSLIVLVATGRHRRYPIIALVGLVVNVGLNFVLIPAYSYQGAAIATLVTDLVVGLWMWHEMRRVPGLRPVRGFPVLRLLGVLVLTAGSGVGLAALLPWPVAVLATAAVYLGAVVVLRAAGPDGLRALRSEIPG